MILWPEDDTYIDHDRNSLGFSIEYEVIEALKIELSHAFHGVMEKDGTPLTPMMIAEIAANTARVTMLKAFAEHGCAPTSASL